MVFVLCQSCKNALKMLVKLSCQLLCIFISTDVHFVSRLTLAPHSFGPSFLAVQSKKIRFPVAYLIDKRVSPKTQSHSSSCAVLFLKYYLGGKVGTGELGWLLANL